MSFKKIKTILLLAIFVLPLSACGEGWVVEKTTAYFPYGNQRTAGSGVVYVRAKLLPERQLNLSNIKTEKKVVDKIMGADDLFKKVQRK